jgi:hypothetical protein
VLTRTSTKQDRDDRDGTGTIDVLHLVSPLADGVGIVVMPSIPYFFSATGSAGSYFVNAGATYKLDPQGA